MYRDSDEDKAGSDEENILSIHLYYLCIIVKELKDKEGDNKIQNPDLQRLFNPDRDEVFGKAYHDDGNSEFYSDENIKLREDLKSEGVVVEAINNVYIYIYIIIYIIYLVHEGSVWEDSAHYAGHVL